MTKSDKIEGELLHAYVVMLGSHQRIIELGNESWTARSLANLQEYEATLRERYGDAVINAIKHGPSH